MTFRSTERQLSPRSEAAERRGFGKGFLIRAAGRSLVGYAATFGTEASVADFTETIAPGAFTEALRSGVDIVALQDHDPSRVLARTRSGTLKLTEDAKGLAFDIAIPNTQAGADVLALAERGDLGGMSFGFTVPKGGERWQGKRRELLRLDLREISVVSAWPAYEGTIVAARMRLPARLARARRFLETV
ncbi:MAG: HK97 family phage prohead protease [Alphaproteobacteria bacterium]